MMDSLLRNAEFVADAPERASSRLKSRLLSRLIEMEQAEGPLRVLSASRDDGEHLCVFEHGVAMLPSRAT